MNPTIISYSFNIEMYNIDNSKLKEYLAVSNKYSLKEFLIFSNASIFYYKRMKISFLKRTLLIQLTTFIYFILEQQRWIVYKMLTFKKIPKLYGNNKSKKIKSNNLTSLEHMHMLDNIYNMQIPYDIN